VPLFRWGILNCVDICSKGLPPAAALMKIKDMMMRRGV
jgi:succinate dehydrogenase/fumarate reductase-like Fe-S protein